MILSEVQRLLPHRTVTQKMIKTFRDNLPIVQIGKQSRRRFKRIPFYAKNVNACWAMDTAFLRDLSGKNQNNSAIIVAVDVFSRYAHAYSCKGATADSVINALRQFIDESGAIPQSMVTDLGCVDHRIIWSHLLDHLSFQDRVS